MRMLSAFIAALALCSCAHRAAPVARTVVAVAPDTAKIDRAVTEARAKVASASQGVTKTTEHIDRATEAAKSLPAPNLPLIAELDAARVAAIAAQKDLGFAQEQLIETEKLFIDAKAKIETMSNELRSTTDQLNAAVTQNTQLSGAAAVAKSKSTFWWKWAMASTAWAALASFGCAALAYLLFKPRFL